MLYPSSGDPLFDSALTDEYLADAAGSGSGAAFEQLVERHSALLRRYLVRFTGDPELAADLVQETWLAVFRGLPHYDPHRPFHPWLYGIATNYGRMALRHRKRAHVESLDDPDKIRWNVVLERIPEDIDEAVSLRDAIYRALDGLDPESREVLLLVCLLGFAINEAGWVQRVSEVAMRQRVHRAKRAFMTHFIREARASGRRREACCGE